MRFARHERLLVAAVIAAASALWAFAEVADEVIEGESGAIDRRVLLAFRDPAAPEDPLGPPYVEEMVRDVTALGGIAVITLLTAIVAGFLFLRGRSSTALVLLAAVLGGAVVNTALKAIVDRPRPDLAPHGSHVMTASFPSGHSFMATATYLTLGVLLAHAFRDGRTRAYLVCAGILLAVLVGVSRVYVGVHYPTDVLAGWAGGGAWALMVAALAELFARRRRTARGGARDSV